MLVFVIINDFYQPWFVIFCFVHFIINIYLNWKLYFNIYLSFKKCYYFLYHFLCNIDFFYKHYWNINHILKIVHILTTAGDTGSNFIINSATGVIQIAKPIDFESLSVNPIQLVVSTNIFIDTTNISSGHH